MKQVRRSSIVGWIGVSLLLCATLLLIVLKQSPQSRTRHAQRIPPSVKKVVDQVAALEAIEA